MKEYSENRIKVPRFREENGFYTSKMRSKQMSKIRGKNTKPEIRFRKLLWSVGIRYRVNVSSMRGNPDLVLKKYKLVVFIDGEFWHGYNWSDKKKKIKANRDFWIPKIERNIQRDKEVNNYYESLGRTVLRFWEHEIKREAHVCLDKVISHINTLDLYD